MANEPDRIRLAKLPEGVKQQPTSYEVSLSSVEQGQLSAIIEGIQQALSLDLPWLSPQAAMQFKSVLGTSQQREDVAATLAEHFGNYSTNGMSDQEEIRRIIDLGINSYALKHPFTGDDFGPLRRDIDRIKQQEAVDELTRWHRIAEGLQQTFPEDAFGRSSRPDEIFFRIISRNLNNEANIPLTSMAREIILDPSYPETMLQHAIERLNELSELSQNPVNGRYVNYGKANIEAQRMTRTDTSIGRNTQAEDILEEAKRQNSAHAEELFNALIQSNQIPEAIALLKVISSDVAQSLRKKLPGSPESNSYPPTIEDQIAVALELAPHDPDTALQLAGGISRYYDSQAQPFRNSANLGWEFAKGDLSSIVSTKDQAIAPIIAALPAGKLYDEIKMQRALELLRQGHSNAVTKIVVSLAQNNPKMAAQLIAEIDTELRIAYGEQDISTVNRAMTILMNALSELASRRAVQAGRSILDSSDLIEKDSVPLLPEPEE